MKIAVNTRLLLKNRLDGIGWFTYQTLKRITEMHQEHRFYFLFDRPYDASFIFGKNVTPLVISPPARHPVLFYIWFEWRLPGVFKKHGIDVFVSPDGYLSLRSTIPSLAVVHDINFVHRPKDLPFLIRKYYNYFFPRFARKAARIATVSQFSKMDIHQSFQIPEILIDVVYNGVNEGLAPLSIKQTAQVKFEYTKGEDYYLFIGSLHPRKNIERLLLAFDLFKKKTESGLKLVIVGNVLFKTANMVKLHKKLAYRNDVIFTGRLSDENLAKLVGAAYALAYVPLFEGFGIPLLEAMKCHVPVICSNVTAMPEVCGDAAFYVDPYSVGSIAHGLETMYNDADLRQTLIEKGIERSKKFSWDKTAGLLWDSIEKILNENNQEKGNSTT